MPDPNRPPTGATPYLVRELAPVEVATGGPLRHAFLDLHAAWIERGLTRWLALLEPTSTRPTLLLAAFEPDAPTLAGALLGLWHPTPCDRFDDLFAPLTTPTPPRPPDGHWHLVAVTTSEHAHAHGLSRHLLGRALDALAGTGHDHAFTLSPVLGLPALLDAWSGPVEDAVLHAASPDGRPALPILRLHLGGGARLDRVLEDSRRDDLASARVNLRFRYPTAPTARAAQRERYTRWLAQRALALTPLDRLLADAPLYRASADDTLVSDLHR